MALAPSDGDAVSSVERAFLLSCVQEGGGIREDGRRLLEQRRLRVRLERSMERSLAEIQLGRTRVAAVTTATITAPFVDRPTEGFLTIHAELSAIASPVFETSSRSATTGRAVEVSRVLERLLKEGRALDTEALCITAGERVWSIRVDVHALDDGGNLLDACAMASVASLRHFRRRDVSLTGDGATVHSYDERAPVPLAVHHTPLCVTFSLVGSGESVVALLDPTEREEAVARGAITFGVNAHRELCLVHKPGGAPISATMVSDLANAAASRAVEVLEALERTLARADAQSIAEWRPRSGTAPPKTPAGDPRALLDMFALVDEERQRKAVQEHRTIPAAARAGMVAKSFTTVFGNNPLDSAPASVADALANTATFATPKLVDIDEDNDASTNSNRPRKRPTSSPTAPPAKDDADRKLDDLLSL